MDEKFSAINAVRRIKTIFYSFWPDDYEIVEIWANDCLEKQILEVIQEQRQESADAIKQQLFDKVKHLENVIAINRSKLNPET